MNRSIWLVLLFGAVLAAPLTVGVSEAEGFWWWGGARPWAGGWGGNTCYYAPCYTVNCDPCCTTQCGWYVGYRPGPIRRLLFGPYRWYYGCTPTYTATTAYYTPACYAPAADAGYDAGGPAPVQDGTPTRAERPTEAPQDQEPMDEEPVAEPPTRSLLDIPSPGGLEEPEPTPPGGGDLFSPGGELPEPPEVEPPSGLDLSPLRESEPPAAEPGLEPSTPALPDFRSSDPSDPLRRSSQTPTRADSGLLTIYVPYDAKVRINGLLTRSQGSRREYVSYGLKPGYRYQYEVEAEVVRDGEVIRDTQTVVLTAGGMESVAFGFNRIPASDVASTW